MPKYFKHKNLIGQKFNRLLVLKLDHRGKVIYWLCRCDCGVEKFIRNDCLLNGTTKSCGCYSKENSGKQSIGEKNWLWKGDKVGRHSLHERFRNKLPNKNICKFCKQKCKTDLANISQKYKTTEDDWMWLCRRCHSRYDNGWIWEDTKWFKMCEGCNKKIEVTLRNFYRNYNGEWIARCKPCVAIRKKKLKKQP